MNKMFEIIVGHAWAVITILLVLTIGTPILNVVIVSLQNMIKKPYHEYSDGGDTLIIYFCQKYGYVPHTFVKKDGKWKRKNPLFDVLIILAVYVLIVLIVDICLYRNGFAIKEIIAITAICLLTIGIPIISIDISRNIMLRRYIKKNGL